MNGETNGAGPVVPEQTGFKAITKITVAGFKSIAEEQSIEVRPLTILAGANSSGKSSMMQPLLLLKQTLEAPQNPGTLLLNGPNVVFTSGEQMLTRTEHGSGNAFSVGVDVGAESVRASYVYRKRKRRFEIESTHLVRQGVAMDVKLNSVKKVRLQAAAEQPEEPHVAEAEGRSIKMRVVPDRCFPAMIAEPNSVPAGSFFSNIKISMADAVAPSVLDVIHLPGLRGNPERTYAVAAIESNFVGVFNPYVASVLVAWRDDEGKAKLRALNNDLEHLCLTSQVTAKATTDTDVEIQVERAMGSGTRDMVNIADVGFGVSQTLPVVVALHAARPGQMVYLEQPEIHLHPRAQRAMAQVLADAARRGVRVVAETHSSLLLLEIQTLVARGELSPDLVKLHWFERGIDGVTRVRPGELDAEGRFGDWPEDFDDVYLDAQSEYLDAVGAQRASARTSKTSGKTS